MPLTIRYYTGFATELPRLIKDLPPRNIRTHLGENSPQRKSLTIWLGLERELPEFNYTGSEDLVQGFRLLGNAYQ